ncbi:unnamed protein product [Tuber aestivum]|uniref:Uncharacterized protein n=1 Tax=Tuber aestivum TaxID=59557 RepID=A0A292Q0R4_9PEZI|nr:unnamed protein product [Tuber aestivum]
MPSLLQLAPSPPFYPPALATVPTLTNTSIISATQKPSPFYTCLAVLVTPVFLLALAAYVITTVEAWSRSPKLSRSYVGGVGRGPADAGPAQWADMSVLEKVEGVLRWEGWWGGRK